MVERESMMCAASRYILVAWVAGLATTSITGSDILGATAALIAVALAYGMGRVFPQRFAGGACAMPATNHPGDQASVPAHLAPSRDAPNSNNY